MFYIVTGRFNNATLKANYEYREKGKYKCIYCCPLELSSKISYDSIVLVLEMNNSTNKLIGIGIIKNRVQSQKYFKVHEEGNNNRYIYIGKYFIEREFIENYNTQFLDVLEDLLFKGYTHSKRGAGLTMFPEKLYKSERCKGYDLKQELKTITLLYLRECGKETTVLT
jgi:hypothetical protein